MAKEIRHFPPVGSDDRFDAIVSKGRRMRHRRQALNAATTGSVVAACIALAVVFGGSNKPAKSDQVFANEGQKNSSSTTVPQPGPPDEMRVTVSHNGDAVEVEVDDPRMPIPTDPQSIGDTSYRTQQCVLVSLVDEVGQPAAEGFDCREFPSEGSDPGTQTTSQSFKLSVSDGLSVGCAAAEERIDAVTTENQRVRSKFSAELPSGLPAGRYQLTVEAVSGFGDGCPDNLESGFSQVENSVAVERTVTVSP